MDGSDSSLEAVAGRLAMAMLPHVPFDGWSLRAARQGAADLGLDPEMVTAIFPRGAPDMIAAFIRAADARMLAACDTPEFRALKVRERVTRAIVSRLEDMAPHREAVRRAAAVLALPGNGRLAARLTWGTADAIWRAAGDTSTDLNYYSKRAIAGLVYSATLFFWVGDESADFADTRAFLARRIDGVMRFEKLKAGWRQLLGGDERPSLLRVLGRLRYPADAR